MDLLGERIAAALAGVYDPCSVAAGRPISVVDMGLVTGWSLDAGVLSVVFCVTFAGCTMAPHFVAAARAELAQIPGVTAVHTRVDTAHIWHPPAPAPMHGKPQAWRTAPA
jgi:metal-sulfur cluster biosynthetic enzyme